MDIKKNFLAGKMNKDNDLRLVPDGEYRDAQNIEVVTSDGSESGTIQNTKGNKLVSVNFKQDSNNTNVISSNAITVGVKTDSENDKIYKLVHNSSDYIVNGNFVGFNRYTGIKSDSILEYTQGVDLNTMDVRIVLNDVYESKMICNNMSDQYKIYGLDTTATDGGFEVAGVRVGMEVEAITPSGQNLWDGTKVVVTELLNDLTTNSNGKIKISGAPVLITTDLILDGVVIKFSAPRVLNFKAGTLEIENNTEAQNTSYTPKDNIIHSINVLGDQLMFTDGRTEPKKVSIPRGIAGSFNLSHHTKLKVREFESSDSSLVGETPIKESHITVIKPNPRTAPVVENQEDNSLGALVTPILGGAGGANFGATAFTMHDTAITNTDWSSEEYYVSETTVWGEGYTFYIRTSFNTNYPDNSFIRLVGDTTGTVAVLKVTEVYANNKYKTTVVTPPSDTYTGVEAAESWTGSILDQDLLFPDEFLTFAYRYKYTDNEYSALSPYSTPAFIPGVYSYSSKHGFNNGMENRLKSISVSEFVPSSTPEDVIGVDIVYRTSKSDKVFILKSIKKSDNSYNVVANGSKGKIDINSKMFGPTLDSKQELRIFDAVPRTAKTQEIIGNRLIYGNFKENYNLSTSGDTPVDLDISTDAKVIPNSFLNSFDSQYTMSATQTEDDWLNFGTNPNTGYTGNDYGSGPIPYSFEYDPGNIWYQASSVYNVPVEGSYSFQLKQTVQAYSTVVGGPVVTRLAIHKCNQTGTVIGDELAATTVTTTSNYQVFDLQGEHVDILLDAVNIDLLDTEFVCARLTHSLDPDFPDYDSTEASRIRKAYNGEFIVTSAPSFTNSVVSYGGTPSIKSDRTYQLGVVYGDEYGRETPVLVEEESAFTLGKEFNDKKTLLKTTIHNRAPHWADYYKFFMKESTSRYHNLVLEAAFQNNDGEFAWLIFNSADINKVSVGDYLSMVKSHGSNNAVTDIAAKWKVIAIEKDASQGSLGETLVDSSSEFTGKFFIKVNLDANFVQFIGDLESVGEDFTSLQNDNGAVFEVVEDKNVDLDLYFEASKAYPIKLNSTNKGDYIKVGSKLEIHPDNPADFSQSQLNLIASFNGLAPKVSSVQCSLAYDAVTINFDTEVNFIPFQGTTYNNVKVRFVDADKSYTSLTLKSSVNVNDLIVSPFTQPSIYSTDNNYIQLPWFNCYSFGNGVQSDTIRDDFNKGTIFPYSDNGKFSGFKASLPNPDYREQERSNQLIFSEIYNDNSGVNGLNQFLAAEAITKSLSPEHGPVQRLFARDTDLLVFCEDKVLKVLAEKDALYKADGNPDLLATNRVLGQAIAVAGDYGISNNPESLASDEYRIYFADRKRGAILRMSMDGLTPISSYGMNSWFRDHLRDSKAIIGSFNTAKDEYNITIHEVTNPNYKKNAYTLSFTELTKGWTSFRSFIMESGFSIANMYYTEKNGDTYLHGFNETRNNFYGEQYESSFIGVVNNDPATVKDFTTLDYEGSQSKVIQFNEELHENFTFNDNEFYNVVGKNGWYADSITTDLQVGEVKEFRNIEGKWHNNIIGKETTFVNSFDGSQENNNLDTSDFNIQGLGSVSTVTLLVGPVNAQGYTVSFLNSAGNDFDGFTINELILYNRTLSGAGQTHEFTIEPKPGYVLDASNFTSLVSNSFVSSINFTDSGTANTYSNTVVGTIIMTGDDFTQDEVIDIAIGVANSSTQLTTVSANIAVEVTNPNSNFNISDFNGDFIDLTEGNSPGIYSLSGFAPVNVGLEQLVTLSYSAGEGYYYTQEPSIAISGGADQGITTTSWTPEYEAGAIIGYTAKIMFEQQSASDVEGVLVLVTDGTLEQQSMNVFPSYLSPDDNQANPITYNISIDTSGSTTPPSYELVNTGDGTSWASSVQMIGVSQNSYLFTFEVETNTSLGPRSFDVKFTYVDGIEFTTTVEQNSSDYISATWSTSLQTQQTLNVGLEGITNISDGLDGVFENTVPLVVMTNVPVASLFILNSPSWVNEIYRVEATDSSPFSAIYFSVDSNFNNPARTGVILLQHPNGGAPAVLNVSQDGYDAALDTTELTGIYEPNGSGGWIVASLPSNNEYSFDTGVLDQNVLIALEGTVTTNGSADTTTIPTISISDVTDEYYPSVLTDYDQYDYLQFGESQVNFTPAGRIFVQTSVQPTAELNVPRVIKARVRHANRTSGWDDTVVLTLPNTETAEFTGGSYISALLGYKWAYFNKSFDANPQFNVIEYSDDNGANYVSGSPSWFTSIGSTSDSNTKLSLDNNFTSINRKVKIGIYPPTGAVDSTTLLDSKLYTQMIPELRYISTTINGVEDLSPLSSTGLKAFTISSSEISSISSDVIRIDYNNQPSLPTVEIVYTVGAGGWINDAYGPATEGGPAINDGSYKFGVSSNNTGSTRSALIKIYNSVTSYSNPSPDATIVINQAN